MKNKFFAVVALGVLVLNLGSVSFANKKIERTQKTRTNQLVALLPASDAVLTIDIKRFFNDALPKILSANQPLLDKFFGNIDDIKAKTGIDIRQFEYLAAGLTAKKLTVKQYDLAPVLIVSGQINAGALLATAKLAANGKYREEKIGERTIYIFSPGAAAKTKTPPKTPIKTDMIDKMFTKLSQETAVVALDANTLALGALPLVRQTVQGRTHVDADVTGLLDRTEVSVLNFAARVPAGMSTFLPSDNDELGKNLNAIRYVSGNIDVVGENTTLHMAAQTVQNAQAKSLFETLESLQGIGKALLGSSKAVDKQVYARMIENAKFSVNGNEVKFDLQVPQADIDILIGMIK